MRFTLPRTVAAFAVLFGILAFGTVNSPMTPETVAFVLVFLLLFGLLSLVIGVKYGEYRATR